MQAQTDVFFALVAASNILSASTLHLSDQPQQQQLQELGSFRHVLSGQLSQHTELSQGSYPPWLLQSSNPGLCLPDSVGTQSPLQSNRQLPSLPGQSPLARSQQLPDSQDQPVAVNLQQQEAHKRNAAALQELMTQADASEPEADDFIADTAADNISADAGVETEDDAAASMQPAFAGACSAADLTLLAQGAEPPQAIDDAISSLPAEPALPAGHTMPAGPAGHPMPAGRPMPAEQPQSRTEACRGAGTPAGPHEEFYSPQEHFLEEAAEQHERQVQQADIPKMSEVDANQADTAAKTPAQHKTPAAGKRRKAAKRYGYICSTAMLSGEVVLCTRYTHDFALLSTFVHSAKYCVFLAQQCASFQQAAQGYTSSSCR